MVRSVRMSRFQHNLISSFSIIVCGLYLYHGSVVVIIIIIIIIIIPSMPRFLPQELSSVGQDNKLFELF
jgi:hypothetical protein